MNLSRILPNGLQLPVPELSESLHRQLSGHSIKKREITVQSSSWYSKLLYFSELSVGSDFALPRDNGPDPSSQRSSPDEFKKI